MDLSKPVNPLGRPGAIHTVYECPCAEITGTFYSRIVDDSRNHDIELTEIAPGSSGVVTAFDALKAALDVQKVFAPIPQQSRHYSQHQIDAIRGAINPRAVHQGRTVAIVTTSGSTGNPRGVELSATQLGAMNEFVNSGAAIGVSLDAPPRWICALPVTSIAGVNVLSRSIAAGTVPVALESVAGGSTFDPNEFADVVARISDEPIFVSLVPTQLRRLLNSQSGAQALIQCAGILIGGGPTPTNDFLQAQDLGLNITYTYGMTETAGGCFFSGVSGPSTNFTLDPVNSRVTLHGPSIAQGYRPSETIAFAPFSGSFTTDDYANVNSLGKLEILGRLDDIVLINGVNVSRMAICRIIENNSAVKSCYVLANLTALVVTDSNEFEAVSADIRAQIASQLGSIAIPTFRVVSQLPSLPNGKLDQVAITNLYG
jgi:O-succinylbenzoic acid--CoA ligase